MFASKRYPVKKTHVIELSPNEYEHPMKPKFYSPENKKATVSQSYSSGARNLKKQNSCSSRQHMQVATSQSSPKIKTFDISGSDIEKRQSLYINKGSAGSSGIMDERHGYSTEILITKNDSLSDNEKQSDKRGGSPILSARKSAEFDIPKIIYNHKEKSQESGEYYSLSRNTITQTKSLFVNSDTGSSTLNNSTQNTLSAPRSKESIQNSPREMQLLRPEHSSSPLLFPKKKQSVVEISLSDDGSTTSFVRAKLKQIEEAKKKLHSRKTITELYFKVFQETIELETKGLLQILLKEVKNGLQQQILFTEQEVPRSHKKDIDILKVEISNLKIQLQKEVDYAFFVSEKLDATEKVIEDYKTQVSSLTSEVKRLTCRVQEFQALSAAKSKKINEMEIAFYDCDQVKEKFAEKAKKHKNRNRKAMYLLYLLHFKGYPVSELYENEIRGIPAERIKNFNHDDSSSLDESVNENVSEDEAAVALAANWKDIEPFLKLQKHWFDSDMKLDDFLFKSPTSSHIEQPSSERNSDLRQCINNSWKEATSNLNFKGPSMASQKIELLKNGVIDNQSAPIMKSPGRKVRDSAKFFNPLG